MKIPPLKYLVRKNLLTSLGLWGGGGGVSSLAPFFFEESKKQRGGGRTPRATTITVMTKDVCKDFFFGEGRGGSEAAK